MYLMYSTVLTTRAQHQSFLAQREGSHKVEGLRNGGAMLGLTGIEAVRKRSRAA